MKKLLLTLALFSLVATSQAVTITYLNTNDYIGNSRNDINANFSNLLAGVQASVSNTVVVTTISSNVNVSYWVSNSADGAISYWLACLTNGVSGASSTGLLYGVASDAAWLVVSNGFGAAGLGTATFHPTNQPNFVFAVTNVFRAVATSATDFVSWESNNADRTIAYYVFCSTNGGGGGGSAQSPIGTNIAYAGFTFSNASQGEFVQVPTTNHVQAAGRVSFFDDRRRLNPNDTGGTQPIIPSVAIIVDATNGATWVGTTISMSNGVPSMVLSGMEGPSSAYTPGFALSTANRVISYNSALSTSRGSPGKTAGDEDLIFAMFRGIDEADIRIYSVPGTASDTVSAQGSGLFFITYVEGGTGRIAANPSKQDFDFVVSGQNTGQVLKVDAATDSVVIRQPGLYYAGTAGTGAALIVHGSVALRGDDTAHTNHAVWFPAGGRIFDDGTNLWYRNNTGAVSRLNDTGF